MFARSLLSLRDVPEIKQVSSSAATQRMRRVDGVRMPPNETAKWILSKEKGVRGKLNGECQENYQQSVNL
jgi:hypothetical protein